MSWLKWLAVCLLIGKLFRVVDKSKISSNSNQFLSVGSITVGISGKDDTIAKNAIVGNLIVFLAMILSEVKLIFEEKFIRQRSVPIFLSLGMEGLFSLIITTVLLVLIGFFKVSFEDALDGIAQLKNSQKLIGIELGM